MSSAQMPCGCSIGPGSQGGASVQPCATHQLDPRGLARMLAASPSTDAPAAQSGFSYSGDPASNAKDAVRFALGDTGTFSQLGGSGFFLTDGEINYLLSQAGNDVALASRQGCGAILSKLAQLRDETTGSVSISWSQVYQNFTALFNRLRVDSPNVIVPFAGGISWGSVNQQRANPDRVKPSFTRDLMQRPDDPEQPYENGYNSLGATRGPL